jgi:hypothetical protein
LPRHRPFPGPGSALLKLEMMRPIESSNLRVEGIVETCINVAEICPALEFYQSLFNFEAIVSDERFWLYGLVPMCCCSLLMAGLMNRWLFSEVLSLRTRHVALATLPLPFPRRRSTLGERDCASVESKLNRKFSAGEAVPVCISGVRMPTCWNSPLQACGRTIDLVTFCPKRKRTQNRRFIVREIRLRPRISQLLSCRASA